MPKVKCFKNPRKFSNGHDSSSTTRVSRESLDAPANPSQAHEVPQQEQAPNLPQQEQAPNLPQQEQTPSSLYLGQAQILPSNTSKTSVHPHRSTGYWRVETIGKIESHMMQCDMNESEVSPDDIVGKMLESQFEGTLNVLKDYMTSKEGGIPEEFASLFAPQSQQTWWRG